MPTNNQLYYTLVTSYGLGAMQNASFLQQQLEITHLAIGDGDGALYEPSGDMAALKNETYRGQLNHVYKDPDNPAMMVFECVIPQTSGGYTVREAGLFTSDGELFAIAKVAETVKPKLEEGAAKELYVRLILELSHADAVTIKIDPSIILATQKWVSELFVPIDHINDFYNPHKVTAEQVGAYTKEEIKRVAYHFYNNGSEQNHTLRTHTTSWQDLGEHSRKTITPQFEKSIFMVVGLVKIGCSSYDKLPVHASLHLHVEGFNGAMGSRIAATADLSLDTAAGGDWGTVHLTTAMAPVGSWRYRQEGGDPFVMHCLKKGRVSHTNKEDKKVVFGKIDLMIVEQEM